MVHNQEKDQQNRTTVLLLFTPTAIYNIYTLATHRTKESAVTSQMYGVKTTTKKVTTAHCAKINFYPG